MSSGFQTLVDVLDDDLFPEADLALRRGRHVDRDDGALYQLLVDGQDHLEPFYRRYGCELVHRSDGYFFLLPSGDQLGRRRLSSGEMLVGQALALLYLDPSTVASGGVVTREQLLGRLSGIVGERDLVRILSPQRRRLDERVAQEAVRTKVGEALRRLGALGFVESVGDDRVRLRSALLRFADPVRGLGDVADALERLARTGEVVVGTDDEGDDA